MVKISFKNYWTLSRICIAKSSQLYGILLLLYDFTRDSTKCGAGRICGADLDLDLDNSRQEPEAITATRYINGSERRQFADSASADQ